MLVEVLVERLLLLRLPRLLQLLVDHRLVEKVLVEVLEEQTTAAAATDVAAAAMNTDYRCGSYWRCCCCDEQ